jgi:solute carrier family 10 (sodium/bile acid cotransporter), member 7
MRSLLIQYWFLLLLALVLGTAVLFPAFVHTVTDPWKPLWAIAVTMFLMSWTMPTQSLIDELLHPWASLWAIFLSYGLVPLAGSLLGLFAPEDVRIGLMIVGSVPCTITSAVLWTRMAGGNEATALMTVIGTVFMSWFISPLLLSYLTATVVEFDVLPMMRDLLLGLIVPTVLGQALRRIALGKRFAQQHKIVLGVLSQCFVLTVIFKAGATVGDHLRHDSIWTTPQIFIYSIVLAVLLHLFVLASGFFSAWLLGFERSRQIAIAFACSQKTLPVSLLLYEGYFKSGFPFAVMPVLFHHVGQLILDTIIARRIWKNSHR